MKIGFVVSFFDTRVDLKKIIEHLPAGHEVVIFSKPEYLGKIESYPFEIRLIDERIATRKNELFEKIFYFFKKIPKSRNNFYLMELFKASSISDDKVRERGNKLLDLVMKLPKVFSYDSFLNKLSYKAATKIDDIDSFVCVTENVDDYFFARLINEKKKVVTHVYSWDHPCKHTRFSNRTRYTCWSNGIKQDLIELQGISAQNIDVIGASQFGYIDEFLKNDTTTERVYPFEYFYYCFAIGIPALVGEEIAVVKQMAEKCYEMLPEVKFVIRPYPFLGAWDVYQELRSIPNVVFDNYKSEDASIKVKFGNEKFKKIKDALGLFHAGSTIGLEGCFVDTPSFIINFGFKNRDKISLYSFVHQSQNEKYLIDQSSINTLNSIDDFSKFLSNYKDKKYMHINEIVRQEFPVSSFTTFSGNLVNVINSIQ